MQAEAAAILEESKSQQEDAGFEDDDEEDEDCDEDEEFEEIKEEEEEKKTGEQKKRKRGAAQAYRMSLNTTAARSDLALLQALIQMNSWREVHLREAKADVIWQFPGHETESKLGNL